jgi:hypothetical protein
MIFSVGFSRLNPKPFNIFTCILQLLQPAGHSANPRPNLALRATVLHRPVRLLLPLTRLKAKRADLRFELETARVLAGVERRASIVEAGRHL